MDFTTFLLLIAAFYAVLLFFDTFFKTCAHYPYIEFLKNTGFEVNLFRLKWKTTAFNRSILRLGNNRPRFLFYWFEIGLYVSLILLPVAITLLLIANYQLLFVSRKSKSTYEDQLILQPLIPGLNLPIGEIGYYAFALLVCSLVHEFGHALAAVKEDVHLNDIGVNVFLLLPVAFVNISTERLATISQWRVLRIMCAGVWHNVVLAAGALVLYGLMPWILTPFYYTNTGVIVTEILPSSHLSGAKGLSHNNIITSINGCVVKDPSTWEHCLSQSRLLKPGYCVTTELVHELDESGPFVQSANGAWDCCAPNNPTHMCFEYVNEDGDVAALPQHTCLPVRQIVHESTGYCNIETKHCSDPFHCIQPLLANNTFLIVLTRGDNDPNVVYIGHPGDVFTTVLVSGFVPKFAFLNSHLADVITRMLLYIIVFSSGLAILNILPCIFFDGHYIVNSLSVVLLKNRIERNAIKIVTITATILGTILLLIYFISSLWMLTLRM